MVFELFGWLAAKMLLHFCVCVFRLLVNTHTAARVFVVRLIFEETFLSVWTLTLPVFVHVSGKLAPFTDLIIFHPSSCFSLLLFVVVVVDDDDVFVCFL